METNNAQTALIKALVAAQRDMHGVEKKSANSFHRYRYASAEDVVTASREVLAQHGLAFLATCYQVAAGGGEDSLLQCRYLLTHEAGGTLEVTSETPVVPEKGRPLDKAVATAKTYDLGYTLRALLLIPRVEEGTEPDQRDDRGYEPKKTPAKAKPAPKKAEQKPTPAPEPEPAPAPEPQLGTPPATGDRAAELRAAAKIVVPATKPPREDWVDITLPLALKATPAEVLRVFADGLGGRVLGTTKTDETVTITVKRHTS